jgi:hypothetical protein
MPDVFSTNSEVVALPLMVLIPFVVKRVWAGRFGIAAYFAAFIAFAYLQGASSYKDLKLGVVFFGGGPISNTGYTIVPATDLVVVLFAGLLPYIVFTMMGQVLVRYDVTFSSAEGEHSISLRHAGMMRELLSFVRGDRREPGT